MSTFLEIQTRIAGDLRRSNILTEIKRAINDAITEAAKTRFYFNEQHESFPTVIGQEYYSDLGITEVDDMWYWQNGVVGGFKQRVYLKSQSEADDYRIGNVTNGQLDTFSRYGGQFRLEPVPQLVMTVYVDGFGKMTPNPLVNDGDTNAWLTEGELYITALAKRNLLRDVIRDYGEARVLEGIADGYKEQLEADTATRGATGTIRSTKF